MKQLVEMPRAKRVGALSPLPTQKPEANPCHICPNEWGKSGVCPSVCTYLELLTNIHEGEKRGQGNSGEKS